MDKWTMRDWIDQGWDYNDRYWPFGHGNKRYEGASYVLGPGNEVIGKLLGTAARVFSYSLINPRAGTAHHRRNALHQQRLRDARSSQAPFKLCGKGYCEDSCI